MKSVLLTLLFGSVLFLIQCDNEDGFSQDLIEGEIAGEEWKFQYAKGYYDPFGDEYAVEIYGQFETSIDPCGVNSVLSYVSMIIPNVVGTYALPFPIESESLKFHQPGVGDLFFVANSGFIEIISIQGRRVGGFLQASYDDQNFIEGTFIFDRCN